MGRLILTDRKIASLKPAAAETLIMDAVVPGLGLRLSPRGKKTFVLVARFGGAKHPARRALGEYGQLTLADARDKAKAWLELIGRGIDPKLELERAEQVGQRLQDNTFAKVAERFIDEHVMRLRTGRAMAGTIRKELISVWGPRPITSITRADVISLTMAIANRPGKPRYMAYLTFDHLRSMFGWVLDMEEFGIESSPCERVKLTRLLGPKVPRDRVLDDNEIAAVWHAAEKLGDHRGAVFQVLMLTGARRGEVTGAKWQEFDLPDKTWTVPSERFKSGTPHTVPLSAAAAGTIDALERRGEYVFQSARFNFSRTKDEVDAFMAEHLGHEPRPWRTHDIRRTVRTKLALLKVPDVVAEQVIGHGRKGLQRIYDLHSYQDEMREALELWAARLRDIVTPPPDNVTKLERRA